MNEYNFPKNEPVFNCFPFDVSSKDLNVSWISSKNKNGEFFLIVDELKRKIKSAFPSTKVRSSYDEDFDTYSISIDSDAIYFSDKYLMFVNKLLCDLEEKGINKIVFTCDMNPSVEIFDKWECSPSGNLPTDVGEAIFLGENDGNECSSLNCFYSMDEKMEAA